ncbi:MAG: hypothetical protein B7Z49_03850 [Hydrogenophilales bacterium 12-63-5]|nr:MAG: hypothetical protein B7Z49_03850 [Hydrogenophilales bacterium 12-63-5]OYY62011.1 MAG: hypothetical protein B7Y50_02510 [Hydrogenophilales bacterium 28-61-11]OYZ58093.1 MAG: hypothetical protein B7Y21_04815 [Hydrogenophilales bacterium 16-61-112]OZA47779.1 MAG: hypothetical protein B7X81_04930 [Hydrogenophilales bacterium 17-61-76]HQT31628.1 hypothetical protein [Thiobacillus sp.]
MRTRLLMAGILVLATQAQAEEGRYEALPLAGADGGKGGGRALIVDTREGHVWVWSENELLNSPNGQRRYGSGFIYQGKLRPGTQPGEIIEPQSR